MKTSHHHVCMDWLRSATLLSAIFFLRLLTHAQTLSPFYVTGAGNYSATGNTSLSWTLGQPGVETFVNAQYTLTQGIQQSPGVPGVYGYLRYANTQHSPLNNAMVILSDSQGNPADSCYTNPDGYFLLRITTPGSYTFQVNISTPWGGVNAADALLVLKQFTGMISLTGLPKIAADVDNSGFVNSIDALAVARRFAGILTSFQIPDWLFTNDTVYIGSTLVGHNLGAICAGDVNTSYTP